MTLVVVPLTSPSIEDGVFEVLATAGDTHLGLGGEDLDNRVIGCLVTSLTRRRWVCLTSNLRAVGKFKHEVEKSTWTLSSEQSTRIEIESFEDGSNHPIRRQRIEPTQRRRDELHDGHRCVKAVLPISSQRSGGGFPPRLCYHPCQVPRDDCTTTLDEAPTGREQGLVITLHASLAGCLWAPIHDFISNRVSLTPRCNRQGPPNCLVTTTCKMGVRELWKVGRFLDFPSS